jgi:general secretion pathway protein J
MKQDGGFTLLELVVAIAIFAVISVGCWQVLERMVTSKSRMEERSQSLRALQRGMWILARDLRALVDRPVKAGDGSRQPALSSLVPGYALVLTRGGWANPEHRPRGELQRVAYALEANETGGKQLVRHYWPVLDRASGTEPHRQQLLTGVETLELQYVDHRGAVEFYWPPRSKDETEMVQAALPMAIRVTLETRHFGAIRRTFSLGGAHRP